MSDRRCSVEGCEKPHDARGLCKMHYARWQRYGEVGEAESRRYSNTATVCTVEGCDGPVVRYDMCNRHMLRYIRHGDPLAGGRERAHNDPLDRLAGFVDVQESGCWHWNGALTVQGYGWVRVGKRSIPAHRWSYELLVEPIPDALSVDHLCHNDDRDNCLDATLCLHRRCVNPDHLEAVPIGVNSLRGNSASAKNLRKTECIHGHPFDEENTYRDPSGSRQCRTCMREWARRKTHTV